MDVLEESDGRVPRPVSGCLSPPQVTNACCRCSELWPLDEDRREVVVGVGIVVRNGENALQELGV